MEGVGVFSKPKALSGKAPCRRDMPIPPREIERKVIQISCGPFPRVRLTQDTTAIMYSINVFVMYTNASLENKRPPNNHCLLVGAVTAGNC